MYFPFKSCEYYLKAKNFTYEGDHANLQWIERCTDPKVIRWRIFMQQFMFRFHHIPGRENMVADWQSRFENVENVEEFMDNLFMLFEKEVSNTDYITELSSEFYWDSLSECLNATSDPALSPVVDEAKTFTPQDEVSLTPNQMLAEVHGHRSGHHGVQRTYELLNKHFPGHGISMTIVKQWRKDCATCAKVDKYNSIKLVPIIRHLKTEGPGRVVGIDYLTLVPDKFGNVGCYVLRDHFTKLVFISATAMHDATAAALAIFSFCVFYGAFDVLMSDPGSDFTSDAISILNKWFGIHHRLSLVDRHESNGVEGANKRILYHLRTLFMDEKNKDEWSSPHNIGWASFLINSLDDSETGCSPYELTFGSDALRRFKIPANTLPRKVASEYIRVLDSTLQNLHTQTRVFQDKLVDKRTAPNGPQNKYQPGDYVLFELPSDRPRPHKLHPAYLGPYEVLKQYKNDVEVRHLSLGNVTSLYVGDLKAYLGDRASALALAETDADQSRIICFLAYAGNPLLRTSLQFVVRFADGSEEWLPWSRDLFDSIPYEEYCRSHRALYPLIDSQKQAATWASNLRKSPITLVAPGSVVFVDLRGFGDDWYGSLSLPDLHQHTYYASCTYGAFGRGNTNILLTCPILQYEATVDHVFVYLYGASTVAPAAPSTLIDSTFIARFPAVINPSNLSRVPTAADFQYLVGASFLDDGKTYVVTRVVENPRSRNIVAYVKFLTTRGRPSKELDRPYHIKDVAEMVASFRK